MKAKLKEIQANLEEETKSATKSAKVKMFYLIRDWSIEQSIEINKNYNMGLITFFEKTTQETDINVETMETFSEYGINLEVVSQIH